MKRKLFSLVGIILVGIVINACGITSSGGGGGSSAPVKAKVVPVTSETIDAATGGVVTGSILQGSGSSVTVDMEIPAGALSSTEELSIGYVNNPPVNQGSDTNGIYLDFAPDGLTFSTPVTVTINYNEADFPNGFDESKIKLYTYNTGSNSWEVVPVQTLYPALDYVVASLNHFSYYNLAVKKYELVTHISPDGAGLVSPSSGTYAAGTTINLFAVATGNYQFSQWQGDASGVNSPVTIVMNSDKDITGYFVLPSVDYYPLNITISPNFSGEVSLSPAGGIYAAGTEVTLTGIPSGDYVFSTWSGDLPTGVNPASLTISSTKNVTAIFSQARNLYTSVTPSLAGSVSPSEGIFPYDTSIFLTAMPNSGYVFECWEGDIDAGSVNDNPGFSTVGSNDLYITAKFVEPVELSINVTPNGAGTVSLSPSGGSYVPGTQVSLAPMPNTGWVFDHWEEAISGDDNPFNLLMDTDKSVTAFFVEETFTLSTSVVGAGSIVISPNLSSYPAGTLVSVIANPDPGNVFVNWGSDNDNLNNMITINMNENKSLQANFDTVWVTDNYASDGKVVYPKLRKNSSDELYIAYVNNDTDGQIVVKKYDGSSWSSLGTVVDSSNLIGVGGIGKFDLQFHNDTPYVAYADSNDSGKAAIKKWNGTSWESVVSPNCPFGTVASLSLAIYQPDGTPYVAMNDASYFTYVYRVSGNNEWVYVNSNQASPVTYARDYVKLEVFARTHPTYGICPWLNLGYIAYQGGSLRSIQCWDDSEIAADWTTLYNDYSASDYYYKSGFEFDVFGFEDGVKLGRRFYAWQDDQSQPMVAKGSSSLSASLDGLMAAGISLYVKNDNPIISFYDTKPGYYMKNPLRVLRYDGSDWRHLSSPDVVVYADDTSLIVI